MQVILDKSYLHGASKSSIENLFKSKNRVLMPDVLFYELMSTNPDSRAKCFSRLPNIENPITLIPNIGQYLRYEMEYKKPCQPLTILQERLRYKFNPKLTDRYYEFPPDIKAHIEQDKAEAVQDRKRFIERAFVTLNTFQDKTIDDIDILITDIATKKELVLQLYKEIIFDEKELLNGAIHPGALGQKWANFRWIQAQIIYGLKLLKKHGGCMPGNVGTQFWERVESEMLDAHYVILSSLSGAIATRDEGMKTVLRMICPKVLIFS